MEDLIGPIISIGTAAATGGIGAVFGAVVRLLPAMGSGILDFFKQKADRKHELDMLDRQIAAAKDGSEQRLREQDNAGFWQNQVATMTAYREALVSQGQLTGVKWVDAFNAFVRPFTAYFFMFLYAASKTLKVVYAWINGATLAEIDKILWTATDDALLGAVLGFYFVDRQLGKQAQRWTSSR